MSAGLRGRLAGPEDDSGIRTLLRVAEMPGTIALAFTTEPSFFDALSVEGRRPRVMVGAEGDCIVGVGVMAEREVYLNGTPARVGYLGSLRLAPHIRRGTALGRGYRMLRRLHERDPVGPFYISTILEDNQAARAILTSGRAGLPTYHEIGRYRTLALPARRCTLGAAAGLRIVRGDEVGVAALVEFLNDSGPARQFFPCYTPGDFGAGRGLLKGLDPCDVAVALHGGGIVGTLGLWDQSAFRQRVVTGYRGLLGAVRRPLNALSRLLLGPEPLPAPGRPVPALPLACPVVRGNRPDVLGALLDHATGRAAARGAAFVLLGLAAGDPLLAVARRRLHCTLHSRIYVVRWPGADGEGLPALDGRPIYLELGSL